MTDPQEIMLSIAFGLSLGTLISQIINCVYSSISLAKYKKQEKNKEE